MEQNHPLKPIFVHLREHLDAMDLIREKLLPIQRQTVRWCSEIIKNVHRGEISSIPAKIEKARKNLLVMQQLLDEAPASFSKDYIQIVKQEFGEAVILYNLVVNDSFPKPDDCSIELTDYAFALADVVGELRRYVLNCIRNENLSKALWGLSHMDEIYSYLFTLDYPNGLVPGLRKKTDMARNILAKTEGDVTVSINIIKLNSNLKLAQKDEVSKL
ncbi:hypothetical protein [Candidatus Lokiarchaeum ossiferum]|uniref:hypothetical protein n=1 Tax=Candidatus Lokiarchaeum ossiferum TaxID=2951803 RepID=UPI00352F832A